MNTALGYLLVVTAAAASVVGVSLLWPRLTSRPRPEVLQAVRDSALTTPVGKEAAKILGVEEEEQVQPINVSDAAASVAGTLSSVVQEKTKEIVVQQVANQLMNQYQQLPQSQQQQIQEFICRAE